MRASRRFAWIAGSALALCLLGFVYAAAASAQSTRPNVLVIVADDLGWHDVGYHGGDIEADPNGGQTAGAHGEHPAHHVAAGFGSSSSARTALLGLNPAARCSST